MAAIGFERREMAAESGASRQEVNAAIKRLRRVCEQLPGTVSAMSLEDP